MKILGYLTFDMHFWPLNFLLLTTRKYIFWCVTNNYLPDIYFLQKEIKRRFIEQELLHTTQNKSLLSTKSGLCGETFLMILKFKITGDVVFEARSPYEHYLTLHDI